MVASTNHRGRQWLAPWGAVLLSLATCTGSPESSCSPTPTLLFTNVQVLDGTGSPASDLDVRVEGDRIADVGQLDPCESDTIIDGEGQILAPGFIDTHSHADVALDENPDALNAVSQGITTAVIGQDGGAYSPFPFAAYLAKRTEQPTAIHLAAYAGHNRLRREVLGDDFRRPATPDEIEAMSALLRDELDAGVLGLSSGLEYEPGIHSETEEVLALAKIVASRGGRYISHIRSEDRWFDEAIDEILRIGREAELPVQISHIKLAMSSLWGQAEALLNKLDAAREQGVDVTADIYPYTYWQSTMMVLLPERDYTDQEAIAEVFSSIAPPEGIRLSRYRPDPELVGRTLPDLAEELELDVVSTFTELARRADQWRRNNSDAGSAEMIIAESMSDEDIRALMSWPHTNICSDGGLDDLHPRGAGSFPRVLGHYSREQGLFPIATAVHKMTGLAARNMGFIDRGRIAPGMSADLVLLDPTTVIDRATPEEPKALSSGIRSVWVAGELVYRDGVTTGARPGRVLTRQ